MGWSVALSDGPKIPGRVKAPNESPTEKRSTLIVSRIRIIADFWVNIYEKELTAKKVRFS